MKPIIDEFTNLPISRQAKSQRRQRRDGKIPPTDSKLLPAFKKFELIKKAKR